VDGEELASLLAEADRCRRRLAGEDVELGSTWSDDKEPEDPATPHAGSGAEVAAAGSGL
jgi:hypothetical protein